MARGGPPRSHENELPPRLFSRQCVEGELCELLRLDEGSAAKGGPGSLEEPALQHYSLVGVHSTHVAWDVFDGCLHHCPVVGGGMDHRSISGGYANVGDAIACLIEEHQVSRLSGGWHTVRVLGCRVAGQGDAKLPIDHRGEPRVGEPVDSVGRSYPAS